MHDFLQVGRRQEASGLCCVCSHKRQIVSRPCRKGGFQLPVAEQAGNGGLLPVAEAHAKDAKVEGVIVGVRGGEARGGIHVTFHGVKTGRSGLVFVCKKERKERKLPSAENSENFNL